jgi:hypothetical protein
MNMRNGFLLSIGVTIIAAACTKSAVEPTGKVSVTAPSAIQPAMNANIRFIDQPVTLGIANGLVTEPGSTTYTFEVATDASFSNKVQTKANVAQGSGGQTTVKLDSLTGATDYYWRARTESGGTVGVFGPTFKFRVGPAISIQPPTVIAPSASAATGSMPSFTVNNATRTGPAGAITYRLEVSISPNFDSLAVDQVVEEAAGGRTTFPPQIELPAERQLYWRVTAIDAANAITSNPSTVATFTTSLAIDLSKVVYLKSPNISGWPRTGFLQAVEQDGGHDGAMCTRFTDPGWPDSPWPYLGPGDDPNFGVFANQWYFANIGGTWYGGAGEWIYRSAPSVCKAGQGTDTIGPDSGFGEPFASWRPRVGEMVGYAITSVARFGVRRTVDQRTQVVVQPWRDTTR